MKTYILTLIMALCLALMAQAQAISVGFQAGLTSSKVSGEADQLNGAILETFKFAGGFHVGATVNFKFTDDFGVRSGLVFNQKGGKYTFNGPSYFVFSRQNTNQSPLITTTQRSTSLKYTNAYIDLPVMAYYKLGKFEVHGGLYGSILAAGSAGGRLKLTDIVTSAASPAGQEANFSLDYNYYSDGARSTRSFSVKEVRIDDQPILVPSILGAYYELNEKPKALFKTLDYGFTAGIFYFMNEALYIGVDGQWGQADMTNQEVDYSLSERGVLRNDKDVNTSIKVSIGFSF